MRYHGVFEVDSKYIEGGIIKWRTTGNGEYVIATKGGKKWFVKRNLHDRYPTRDLPKPVYERYKADADALQKKQERLRALMKGLDLKTDHIVVEEENFWDEDSMFTTVTALVPGVLSDDYDYSVLRLDQFLNLARTASEAMEKLHACGVIHGDIKVKNVVVTNDGGVYTPYLIDFDSSYPADAVPDRNPDGDASGSPGYQSPELLAYSKELWERDTVTTATDVFSLGVVFHKWWTGKLPEVSVDYGSAGVAVYLDEPVTIHEKFNVRIGKNCGATLQSLINWMFAKEPKDRPTAKQVVEVLADKLSVPEKYHKGDDVKPFETELWDAHKSVAELLPIEKLKDKGIQSLKRVYDGSGSAGQKYRVVGNGGAERVLSITELCDIGYAVNKGAEIDEPWDEHVIEFASAEEIVKKGYAKIKKAQISFQKRYLITTASGQEIDKGCDWLIAEGLAHPKLAEIDADTPWPEHGKEYVIENMTKLGVKSISRMEVAGQHRYKIVYNVIIDGKNKTNEKVPANNLKLMGFIR